MKPLIIFYDGGCGLCGQLKNFFEKEAEPGRLQFVPYQSPRAERWIPRIADFQPEREMLALTPEGERLSGVESWLKMLGTTRRFRLLAKGLGLPVIRPLTRWVYRSGARNRRVLSRFLGLKNLTSEEIQCERCAW